MSSSTPEESKIERSLKHKRNYSNCSLQKQCDKSKRKLFEQFLIIGVPPDESPKPKILYLYPASPLLFQEDEFNQTIPFCFPNGMKELKQEFSKKTMLLSQFVFRLNGGRDTIYGVCTHLMINPRRIPFFASESTKNYPYCFCILTTNPILSVHFQYLTYLTLLTARAVDNVKRPAIEPTICKAKGEVPIFQELEIQDNCGRWKGTRFSQIFLDELSYYRSLRQYVDRDKKYILADNGMSMVFPRVMSDSYSLAMPTLDVLFSNFSLYDIVRLYSALLLEHHTIFISTDLHRLTLSVLAARSLISPFRISASILPVVPNDENFLALLEAPVPYIIGLPSKSCLKGITLPGNVCILNLDQGSFIDNELTSIVPKADDLIRKLQNAINEFQDLIVIPPKRINQNFKQVNNPKYREFINAVHPYMRPPKYLQSISTKYAFIPPLVENILNIFSKHLAPDLENLIKPCFITDSTDINHPVTVFNSDLFLDSIKPKELPFYKQLINTSIFQLFCDGKTDEMDVIKSLISKSCLSESTEDSDSDMLASYNSQPEMSFDNSPMITSSFPDLIEI